ncbi:MAG: hypothetical protein FJX57_02575 [Alphaproteobacteria bacterium]|nr:hypothetical protein [Alphaproteobacteria bacterium]
MSELAKLWRTHRLSRPAIEFAALVRRGLPWRALEAGLVAIAEIIVVGDRFEFASDGERGERALVVAVKGDGDAHVDPWIACDPVRVAHHGQLLDLVAETPNGRVVSLLGAADVLGVVEPQMMATPRTRLWRLSRSWLRAGCDGVVLVDPRPLVRQRALLALAGPIVAEDAAHAADLRAILAAPMANLPRVIVGVPQDGRAAA